MATKKKVPPKKEVKSQRAQSVKKEEASAQEGKTVSEEKVLRESKSERVIVILSAEDSVFLSQFSLPRSAVSRAVLRGAREFMVQFATKEDVTEQEITEALQSKLK